MVDRQDRQGLRQALSDLMDGAADESGVVSACAAWRGNAEARADWYTYHLIGDVLRSEDLAHAPARDEAFLAALRGKLADEPVVLAPRSPVAVSSEQPAHRVANGGVAARSALWRRAWVAPTAVAAGFMAVAGALLVTRVAAPGADASQSVLAAGQPSSLPAPQSGFQVVSTAPAPAATPTANGKLIRDARLDRYLAAHKQYGNSSVLAMPAVSVSRGAAPAVADR
ncbi:sigma-E factor negative regulatory protein [Aquincola sp. MAHUQ-54]|uniref:Sigma-E factor negative regulatory protein n=1 Tax=Aquincola agrisoli TaxID=3119538 RepID=A0AAW9QD24_9BURK